MFRKQLYLSRLEIIGHGNSDNNLESPSKSIWPSSESNFTPLLHANSEYCYGAFSILTIYRWMVRCLMNWKGFGRILSWSNRGPVLVFVWREWGKWKTWVVTASVRNEVRNENLLNISAQCYHRTSLLGLSNCAIYKFVTMVHWNSKIKIGQW
jgi:hypothetical protein